MLGISWAGLGRRHAGSLGSRQARALCGTMRGACSAEDSAAHAAGAQQLPVASGVRVGRQRKPGDGARDGPLGGLSRVVSTRRCYAGAAGAPAGARLGADAQHAPRPTSGQAGTQCKGKVRRSGEGGGGEGQRVECVRTRTAPGCENSHGVCALGCCPQVGAAAQHGDGPDQARAHPDNGRKGQGGAPTPAAARRVAPAAADAPQCALRVPMRWCSSRGPSARPGPRSIATYGKGAA